MIDYKLHIPGPVDVSKGAYDALTKPVMGHRSPDFVDLYQVPDPASKSLHDGRPSISLYIQCMGGNGGAVRNLSEKKVLCCMCGAFSSGSAFQNCGKPADALSVEWGSHIDPAELDSRLATGEYDLVTLVHNETSCGMMNPLEDIMNVLSRYPEVLSVIDTVSSFSVVSIPKDKWGIDVILTGSQKALALPPGLALFSVSERAFERAKPLKVRIIILISLNFSKTMRKE